MQLPGPVRRIVEERAEAVGFPALKRAAAAMSDAYRAANPAALARLPAADRVAAYLVTRLPATYAAALRVLGEVRRRMGERRIGSILDVGAGTGAASLAAHEIFPDAHLTLMERDSPMAEAARLFLPASEIRIADVDRLLSLPPHDLVLSGYAVGELKTDPTRMLWDASQTALVVIEPGTTGGYELLMRMRRELLQGGAHMLAPCPSSGECPLRAPDWCHFAGRVERSSLHRRLKDAELGYEDEKFSYIALSREEAALPPSRIIRRPRQEPGKITLTLCQPGATRDADVRKRDREAYRKARHADWGDEWD